MAHEIFPGSNSQIIVMRLSGALNYDDMTADEKLGLNEGRPVYVLLDASQVDVALPENFLSGARGSYFTNPNLEHMALYVKSAWLKAIGEMVAKLTRRKDKLTVHSSYEAAMAHLVRLTGESKAVR